MKTTVKTGILKAMLQCVAKETARYAINGVRIERNGNATTLVATDGKCLIEATVTHTGKTSAEEGETILQAEQIKDFKPHKAAKKAATLDATIEAQGVNVRIESDGIEGEMLKLDGTFPSYRDLFPDDDYTPADPAPYKMSPDPKGPLCRTLRAIHEIREAIGSELSPTFHPMSKENGPLMLTFEADNVSVRALVMPIAKA